ncbi:F-box/LRR-repeat protein 12 isoform X2 [Colius striatus]|nr:F-box/LRR-repeat protein 12 isoform X2 [Colius striatus]XP_061871619.1 F-box/LRR-repeat protein 12 isoform X2 [Colius striatus]XP_061871620.1 F-box/LRR-repeat protein 12 isoform X2 [Colius striatus]
MRDTDTVLRDAEPSVLPDLVLWDTVMPDTVLRDTGLQDTEPSVLSDMVLPDTVLLRILALLSPRDRLRAARVSRRWRRLARDREVWRHVDLSEERLTPRALWALARGPLLPPARGLRLRGSLCSGSRLPPLLSPALAAALARSCPFLSSLWLSEADLRKVPFASLPPTLRTLELQRCEIPAAWFRGPARLRRLELSDVPAFSDRHLLAASCHSPLSSLSLAGTYRLTDEGVTRAAPHLRGLERLRLSRCPLGDAAIAAVSRLPRLRHLDIGGAAAVTAHGLASVAALRELRELRLALSPRLPPGSLLAVCHALPRLRRLGLAGDGVSDGVLDTLRAAFPLCSVSHAA